jgi:intracellular septation protein A
VASAALLLWGTARRLNHLAVRVFAILVVILGTVTAFLSGDKFDTLRAAIVAAIMFLMSCRTGKKTAPV